jgi:hypothetical protein
LNKLSSILLPLVVFHISVQAQSLKNFSLSSTSATSFPASNVVNDIIILNDSIWVGTERGLDFSNSNGNFWRHFDQSSGFKGFGISALSARGPVIWVAEASSFIDNGARVDVGEGLHISLNGGFSWTYIAQPVEPKNATIDTLFYGANKIRALAVPVTAGNITYDIAITSAAVWTANYYGMLRKSTDNGASWTRVVLPPDFLNSISPNDSLKFDLSPSTGALGLSENLNHRVFSLYASSDSVIWVGTAGGINKSTDGGVSWKKISHQNQLKPVSGNFVVALNEQRWKKRRILWAATVNAADPDEQRGVSFSEDGGQSWTTTLIGEFAHNIGFKDSVVYVAADAGLYRSSDFGVSWIRSGSIVDQTNLQRVISTQVISVAAKGDTVWVGGNDGIAYTIDSPTNPFGTTWKVFRTYQSVGNTAGTYSYPSPFSPDDEVVRIHYGTQGKSSPVTIRIFNYGMQPVKTLIQNTPRSAAFEQDEIWNGRDDFNNRVSNGVYFYRVDVDGLQPAWGKIYVIQ